MKNYSIPIIWESYTRINVDANSLQEAIEIALRIFLSIPDENYIEDSFGIDGIVKDEYPNETFDINIVCENI